MKFNSLLRYLFAFAMFFAVDEEGGGNPDDQTPPEDDPKPDTNPELEKLSQSLRAMEAQLEQERKAKLELENKIKEREQSELEKQGEFEKLYKAEKEKNETREKNFALSQAMSAFKAEAIKQGCQHVDDLAQIYQKDIRKAKVDLATYQVDTSNISEIISKAKEEKSFFFNKSAPKTEDIDQKKSRVEEKTVEDMSIEDLKNTIKTQISNGGNL